MESASGNQIRFAFAPDNSKTISDYLVKLDKFNSTAWEGQPSVDIQSFQKTKINFFNVVVREEYLPAADITTTVTYFKISPYIVAVSLLCPPGNDCQADRSNYEKVLNSLRSTETGEKMGFIKKAYINDNQKFIDVDFVIWVNDPSAPNGYRISNTDQQTQTLEVSETTPVVLMNRDYPVKRTVVSFDEFIKILNDKSDLNGSSSFFITSRGNKVVGIQARYTP